MLVRSPRGVLRVSQVWSLSLPFPSPGGRSKVQSVKSVGPRGVVLREFDKGKERKKERE